MHPLHTREGWITFLQEHVTRGGIPYLISFMFDWLPGSERAVRLQQRRIVEEVYARALTRAVRRPRAPAQIHLMPLWICAPDFPIYKRLTGVPREGGINGGQHVQGIAVVPRSQRKFDFENHVQASQSQYCGHTGIAGLSRLHVVRITHDLPDVFDYTTKMMNRGRVDEEDLILLPRSMNEVCVHLAPVGRKASIFGDPK